MSNLETVNYPSFYFLYVRNANNKPQNLNSKFAESTSVAYSNIFVSVGRYSNRSSFHHFCWRFVTCVF